MKNHAFYKPNVVQIEFVQGCNRRCDFCAVNGFESKLHYIKKSVLKKQCELIAESNYNPRISIAGNGEPSLHPHFISCIELIREILPQAHIQFLTNGYSIKQNYDSIIEIFDAGVNDICLDEYSDNKFEYESIHNAVSTYNNTHSNKCIIENLGQKNVAFHLPKIPSNHRVLIVPPIDGDGKSITRSINNRCGVALPPDTSCKDKVCAHVFRECIFRWDGWVNICCNDFRGDFRIVNCIDEEIKHFDDIWRHDTFEALRRVLFHKKRIFFPCNVCNAKSLRPGLLPDYVGKDTMEEPTEEDIALVKSIHKIGSLAKKKPRKWEIEAGCYVNGEPIKE